MIKHKVINHIFTFIHFISRLSSFCLVWPFFRKFNLWNIKKYKIPLSSVLLKTSRVEFIVWKPVRNRVCLNTLGNPERTLIQRLQEDDYWIELLLGDLLGLSINEVVYGWFFTGVSKQYQFEKAFSKSFIWNFITGTWTLV